MWDPNNDIFDDEDDDYATDKVGIDPLAFQMDFDEIQDAIEEPDDETIAAREKYGMD